MIKMKFKLEFEIEIAAYSCAGFIGIGEVVVMSAGVASADSVAGSHCEAGVEDECNSSNLLSNRGTGLV